MSPHLSHCGPRGPSTCVSEDARRRDGAQGSQTAQMDEKYCVQNIESPADLGLTRERQHGGADMLSLFIQVGMLAQEAHKSVHRPFSSINFFCNINDKGDDKEPIDY